MKTKTINNPKMKTMKTTMKTTIKTLAILSVLAVFTSCDDDDVPPVINEEEVITTVEYTLTNAADATNEVIYKFVDLDSSAPVITTTGNLMANSSYMGSIKFLNETETPVDDITIEVIEEADEHEVFYIPSISDVTVSKDDMDASGNPLGVRSTLQTGAAATGTLTIVLRHEPLKPNDGTLLNAGGETDVEVVFDLNVM